MGVWAATAVTGLVCALVLVLPGVPAAYAAGLRGLTAWGLAPLLTGGIVAASGVVAAVVGIRFSPAVVVGAALGLAALAWGVRRLTGGWLGPRLSLRRPRRLIGWTVALTAVPAALLTARRMLRAIGDPTHVAQTYDTAYHLNSVKLMLDTGDASTLHMTLTDPGASSTYYPGLWHGLTTLVIQLTGAPIPTAANWVSVAIAVVVWPLALLAFARVVFGPRPVLLGLTAALAFAMTQFPTRLLAYGILYPNLLSYAYLPALLAAIALVLWRARGWARLVPLGLVGVGCLAIVVAQPNGLFTVGYVVVPMLVQVAAHASGRAYRARKPMVWIAAMWAGLLALFAVAYSAAGRVPMVAEFRESSSWPLRSGRKAATLDLINMSALQPGGAANYVVAGLIAVGAVTCLFVRRWRWLPFGYAILGLLYVVCMGQPGDLRMRLTGYWYTDAERLAAQLPLLGVPLAVVGLAAICYGGQRFVAARSARFAALPRSRVTAAMCVVTVVLGLLFSVVLPRTAVYRDAYAALAATYAVDPDSEHSEGLLDEHELRMMETVELVVPADEAVIGNPWDGSSLTYALADRTAIYPHMKIAPNPDAALIATHLFEAKTDPRVCAAVRRQHVGYVLRMGRLLWGSDPVGYVGLDGLVEAGVARLVSQDGRARLYEITACD